jgi:hypothetical protein
MSVQDPSFRETLEWLVLVPPEDQPRILRAASFVLLV